MTADVSELENLKSGNGHVCKVNSYDEPPTDRRRRLLKQVALVGLVSLGYFCLGTTLTWPSPALSDIDVNNVTLVGTEISFSSAEKDMTGSLVYLGTLFGAWFSGWMVSSIGRYRSLQISVIPYLIGWILTALGHNVALILTGRFVVGLAGGATSIAGYAYVVELSDTKIRGMMATLPTMGIVLGNLYTVSFGYILKWQHLTFVCLLPLAAFALLTFLLPESPSFLVIKGRRQAAIAILRRLRGEYADVEGEVAELERRNAAPAKDQNGSSWKMLLKKDVLKRVLVVSMLFFTMQFCGNFVFMIHTTRILQAAGAPIDPDAVTAIAGALRVAGTLAAIFLLDIIGRRYSLVISHAVNAGALAVLGAYVYLAENAGPEEHIYETLSWVPTVCLTVSLFICDIGVHPVPYILSSEYFSTSIRSQASSLCISAGTIFSFLALQLYSPMQELLTQAGLYMVYAFVSVVGFAFSFYAVTETKGKNVG
ncbi:facilitated trehalose transporter Tret1-like [Macrobrachium nipponense]|uniref:facilitated trehalose transporter Tret1-like n=1 Tax=Macrobrachium nipponense TaxID=159736 RepID=UPI0030C897C9